MQCYGNQTLSYLYNGQNRLLPNEQLSDLVQHTTLTVNEEEAFYLERSTRGQASTPLWFEQSRENYCICIRTCCQMS